MFHITAINQAGERFTKSFHNYREWEKQIQKIKHSKVLTFCSSWQD